MSENLDVVKFQKRCDPFCGNPWGLDHPIMQNDVRAAIRTNNLLPPNPNDHVPGSTDPLNHITRIAWFVVSGWNDPINVDMGVPSLGCYPKWPLEDGNHRFAAAIIRGDSTIRANMSGAVNEIKNFIR